MSTLTLDEKSALLSLLSASTDYLEFGAGESTLYAASTPTIRSISTVESSRDYVQENLAHLPEIDNAVNSGKLKFIFIDIGRTVKWGHPENDENKSQWPEYSRSVFREKNDYDLILVDGRFRVACALQSILNSSGNATILIHDFWNRPQYRVLLKYLDVIGKHDRFGVFHAKENNDEEKIRSDIRRYQYLPDDMTKIRKVGRFFRKNFVKRPLNLISRLK